mgnify:CR=1 FL=1
MVSGFSQLCIIALVLLLLTAFTLRVYSLENRAQGRGRVSDQAAAAWTIRE